MSCGIVDFRVASFAIPRPRLGVELARIGPQTYLFQMFEDWKRAWEQAKANFERELDEADIPGQPSSTRASSMRRDLANARRALERLNGDIVSSRHELEKELAEVQTCERRAEMAERIADAETARIAQDYAQRHRERAGILGRKVEVLQDELTMRQKELAEMEERAAAELAEISRLEENRVKHDAEFRQLDQQRRERAAEERLEELKKRMK
jgi:phage shock protein A